MPPVPFPGREDNMTLKTASAPSDARNTPALSGAEVLMRALAEQGVEVIFGYPGGAVLPIYDALFKQNQIRHVLVRPEQAAVPGPYTHLMRPTDDAA